MIKFREFERPGRNEQCHKGIGQERNRELREKESRNQNLPEDPSSGG
jgi:hypothetical protein